MKRKIARVDANQSLIVARFRDLGYSVVHLHAVGNGCPDIAVARNGVTMLVEIKNPNQSPSRRKLTPDELIFQTGWRGRIERVETVEDVERLAL